jgi:hypothetical protein
MTRRTAIGPGHKGDSGWRLKMELKCWLVARLSSHRQHRDYRDHGGDNDEPAGRRQRRLPPTCSPNLA